MKFLNDWPARWAAIDPDHVVVADPATSLTWRDLDAQAGAIARFLQVEARVTAGDRVAVLAENRAETVAAFFAAARLRAALLPLNHKLAPMELARVLADAEPRALIVSGSLAPLARELLASMKNPPVVIAFDGAADASWSDVIRGPRLETQALVDENDPWLVLYTSGSTGQPKGALITHRQVIWNALHTGVACDLVRGDATITYTPLFYTGGWNVLSTPLWYHGGRVHLLPAFDGPAIASLVARERVTTLFGVPTTLSALLETDMAKADLSHLRVLLVGGASCPRPLVEAWASRGILLRQGYGLTEVGPNCFGLRPEDALRKNGAIGRPNLHLEYRIADERGETVRRGGEGELYLRGPTVFGGYFRNEAATRAALDPDGWFRTGDVVREDEEGHLWVIGRKSDMFKSGGEKVYAGEVEAAIAAHEAVAEVVVLGIPDERWGEVGRAVVVARPGHAIDPDELKAWLAPRLARFKIPKSFVVAPPLPRTETGKIARAKVRELYSAVVSEKVGAC